MNICKNIITFLLIISVFVYLPDNLPKAAATMPPLYTYTEADVTGAVITRLDFSPNLMNRYMQVTITNIENLKIDKQSNTKLEKGMTISVLVSGTEQIIKPGCQPVTIPGPCVETDPDKLFANWNSYKINTGETIKFHIRQSGGSSDKTIWQTEDSTIQKVSTKSSNYFLPLQSVNSYLGLGVIALIVFIVFLLLVRPRGNKYRRF